MEILDHSLATDGGKLQEAGFEQAPEVVAGAIRAIYWDGMIQLSIASLGFALLGVFLFTLVYGVIKKHDEMVFIGGLVGAVLFIFTIGLNVSNNPWLKVFDPQAAFYQQIMKVGTSWLSMKI